MTGDADSTQLVFAAIADDLTGGVELASILVAGGVRTQTFVGEPLPGSSIDADAEAVVVAVRSRVADAEWAAATFRSIGQWIKLCRPRQVFFKYCGTFDSTPAGNIGCCAEALMDVCGATRTLFCPTFPENGRTVYAGHLFVWDQLVSESSKRFDPLTPMTDPTLVSVLRSQAGRRGVGLLPRRVLLRGAGNCERHLSERREAGESFFIADAVDDNDLRRVAELTVDWPLMTGGSTIAEHYPALWRDKGYLPKERPQTALPPIDGPGAVLAGSCSDRTLAQLSSFEDAGFPLLFIDLRRGSIDAILEDVRLWARSCVGDRYCGITVSADVETVSSVQAIFGRHEAARLGEEIMARSARLLVDMGVRRLAVAGGETSGAVMDGLDIGELKVGPYVPKGIALAHASLPAGKVGLCLKSGRIGADDVLQERLDALAAGTSHD
jgi:3-dehydrotetronate 4-kinase